MIKYNNGKVMILDMVKLKIETKCNNVTIINELKEK